MPHTLFSSVLRVVCFVGALVVHSFAPASIDVALSCAASMAQRTLMQWVTALAEEEMAPALSGVAQRRGAR